MRIVKISILKPWTPRGSDRIFAMNIWTKNFSFFDHSIAVLVRTEMTVVVGIIRVSFKHLKRSFYRWYSVFLADSNFRAGAIF